MSMGGYDLAVIIKNILKGSEIDLLQFKDSLSSKQRLKQLKKKKVDFSSTKKLLLGLGCLNKHKMLLCLFLFSLKVALTISSPFIINGIIQNILEKQQASLSFPAVLLLIVAYKLLGSLVLIWCDFLYTSLGFEYFAYLYWFIMNSYQQLFGSSGKKVNIIQCDCTLITSIAYSSLTSFFYLIEIVVLYSMLIYYLIDSTPFSVFAVIVTLYLISQSFASFVTYKYNRNYMMQKDFRLSKNISTDDNQVILQQREKELFANKKYLFTKLLSKFVSTLFPILINLYVFTIADRSTFSQNQYTILIVINLIRNPISEIMLAMNLNVEILNSCKRIVALTNPEECLMQQSLGQQSFENEKRQVSDQIVSTEKGNVAFKVIFRYFLKNTPPLYFFGLLVSLFLLFLTRFYGFFITQHIIGGEGKYYHYIGLGAQTIAPILFYLMLITAGYKVSSSLFLRLKKHLDYQTLNRISGDIAAIDRATTINLFEICSSFFFIIGSYLYSIVSLGIFRLQCALLAFLLICIWLAIRYNRFIMYSRREVVRKELKMKAIIIKGLLESRKIKEDNLLKRTWRQIFECKEMGLFIQSFYLVIIHLLLLVLSLAVIIISDNLQLQKLQYSILLMACLTIDSDISSLFYAAVRLELSLVSFERVLNTLIS